MLRMTIIEAEHATYEPMSKEKEVSGAQLLGIQSSAIACWMKKADASIGNPDRGDMNDAMHAVT